MNALGNEIDGILDMTIVYPDGVPSYGDLWQGNIKRLAVDVRHIEIPAELFASIKNGGYEDNEATKEQMFAWVEELWQQKDARIAAMLDEFEV